MTDCEAKEIIEKYKGLFPSARNEDESLDVAIKALEKQIPKEAIITGRNNAINTDVGYCPICNGAILRACDNKYCPDCGQKLDWSNES